MKVSQSFAYERTLLNKIASQFYALVDADPEDRFVLTASGAESINHVIFSVYVDIARQTGKNHFIASCLDEAPAILTMSRLEHLGCVFHMAPASAQGYITRDHIAEVINPRTVLISLSAANALTGVIQPIEDLIPLCRERGILVHVDATHVLGKGDFSFKKCSADILTFDGFVPGTGGLFLKKGMKLSPFILGGQEQMGMRAGRFHVSALEELYKLILQKIAGCEAFCLETAASRFAFENMLLAAFPDAHVHFREERRLPDVTALAFPKVHGEALSYLLARRQVPSSLGGGNYQQLEHLLKASGVDAKFAHASLSFNSDAFSPHMAEVVIEQVNKLKRYAEKLA